MEKLKVNDIIETIKKGYYNDENENQVNLSLLCDYDATQYLSDTLHEIADYCVDIYTCELLEWAKNNYYFIEDALNEYGTPTDSKGQADFIKIIQQGQYYANYEEINNNLEDMLKIYVLYHLDANGIKEITEEQDAIIDELVQEWKDDDILGGFDEIIERLNQNDEDEEQ